MNLNLSQTVAQGIASNGLSGAAVLAKLLTTSQLNLLVLFAIDIVLQLQLSITPVTFEQPPPPTSVPNISWRSVHKAENRSAGNLT